MEDDPSTQFMMGEMLEFLGYPYEIAEDGEACMSRLDTMTDAFDLILMDIHIPRSSGLDTSLKIRNRSENPPRDTPIIALTADSAYHSADAVAPYGINDVLPKPVGLNSLDRLITGIASTG
ncbi:MAG: response regulator [Pseudomonadota bacterium]